MIYDIKSPILVQLEVTYDCNKNCVHCYNYWRTNNYIIKNKSFINKELMGKIIDDIIDAEAFHVVITGGEPLLVFDEIYPYLEKLKNNNISISLNSNLMIMNKKIAERLKLLNINHVLVSLPASNEDLDIKITNSKNSFSKTKKGIQIAVANGISVTANMVVTKKNYDDIYDTAKLAKKLGAKKFSINRAMKPENCNNFDDYILPINQFINLPYIMKKIKDEIGIEVLSVEANPLCFIDDYRLISEVGFNKVCSAGKYFCAIDSSYNIRPCILISEKYDGTIKEAWKKMINYRNGAMIPDDCKDCEKRNICAGGCKSERKQICNDINHPDPFANLKNKLKFKNSIEKENSINIYETSKFKFDKRIRFRDEAFGGIVLFSIKDFVAVDKSVYTFIKENLNVTFDINYISSNLNFSKEDIEKLLKYLIHKKIIHINNAND